MPLREKFRNFSRRFNPSSGANNEKSTLNGTKSAYTNGTSGAYMNGANGIHTNGNTIRGGGLTNRNNAVPIPPNNQPLTPPPLSPTGNRSVSSVASPIQLRAPQLHRTHSAIHTGPVNFHLPDIPWLCGTWHVTHSTLPMWRNKRNVRIVYTRLPSNRLDDLVSYQKMTSTEVHIVHGRDTPKKDGAFVWRGKGLLKVASSKWEVLGWGGLEEGGEQWVVIYFAKTLLTPAGIDICSRKQAGLSDATVRKLQRGLSKIDGKDPNKPLGEFGKLVTEIHAIRVDGARPDILYGQ